MLNAFAAVLLALTAQQPPSPPPEPYTLGPDSQVQAGVPKGRIEGPFLYRARCSRARSATTGSTSRPNTTPAQPAAVMVFQDGHRYVDRAGIPRARRVRQPDPQEGDAGDHRRLRQPRSFRRDVPREPVAWQQPQLRVRHAERHYARFLVEEMLPEVGKKYNLTADPDKRAIAGASSGGICAFTVAWERPDAFRKVLSHIGSFTNIRGGHVYPALDPQDRPQADPRLPPGRLRTTSTTSTATGRWPTRRWPPRSSSRATTTGSSSATAPTRTSTAARSCPTRCAGCGATSRLPNQPRSTPSVPIRKCRLMCRTARS